MESKRNSKSGIVLFMLLIVLSILVNDAFSQEISDNTINSLEFSYGTEDKAKGLGFYHIKEGLGFTTGFSLGTYNLKCKTVDHQKYKIGLAADFEHTYGDSFILSLSACKNQYQFYGVKDVQIDSNITTKKVSFEVGVRYVIKDYGITGGFNYDISLGEGSFTIGIVLSRK